MGSKSQQKARRRARAQETAERRAAEPAAPVPGVVAEPSADAGGAETSDEPRAPAAALWALDVAIALGAVALTCLLYAPALDLGFFHLDDPGYVVDNPWIQSVNAANVKRILTTPYFYNYSPLHLFSYMLDWRLAGESARAFHLSSQLWAGGVAALLYLLGVQLFGRRLPAAIAALLFVVHPAHVEAIAWISSRKDLVAAFFAVPAVAAYLRYRARAAPPSRSASGRANIPPAARRLASRWYATSLVLFLLAVAGKLSVVLLPAILLAFDILVEQRRDRGILLDKIPFAVIAVPVVLMTVGTQPQTGSLVTLAHATFLNFWLLTGFGDYTMLRPKPETGSAAAAAGMLVAAAAVTILPLVGGWLRRLPGLPVALFAWVLFALLPSQVLSFVHPVTDRYLFFPSVGLVLSIGWLVACSGRRFGRSGTVAAVVAAGLIALLWTDTTRAYLDDWRDPRSVWFAATTKSGDVRTHHYLGGHYQDIADELMKSLERDDHYRLLHLADLVWSEHQHDALVAAWDRGVYDGPETRAFRAHLRGLALAQFERAIEVRGARVVPRLFLRVGKLAMDTGDLPRARSAFESAAKYASRHPVQSVRQEAQVRIHYALGLVAWREHDYARALDWIRMAVDEQTRFGGNWVPDAAAHRDQLERMVNR